MNHKKFDSQKLQKLNNPQRLIDIPPDYIQGKLNIGDSDVIVEIGAGTAFFSIAFHRQLKASTTYACDISDIMIAWIKKNVTPIHPNIIAIKNRENSVPLDSGFADLVFMIVLHHELDNPPMILDESYRILKPGGKIFIVDWKKEDMNEGPPPKIRYLPEQIKDQLMKSQFNDVCIFNELPKHSLIIGKKE
jgi:ubiquinone/menaquinone biosynthesis C-methylase UbiE